MPFRSQSQRRFLFANHPDIAKRWAHEYPGSNNGLPAHVKKRTTPKRRGLLSRMASEGYRGA